MDRRIPLLDLHYFPSIEYFVLLSNYEKVQVEAHENYEKQSYRNRCYILGSNKIQALTVPVLNGNSKVIVKDIKIDYSQKWLNIHWRSIASAYGKSPFFMFYGDYFEKIIYKKYEFLYDLNFELLLLLIKFLGLKTRIETTSVYQKDVGTEFLDLRSTIHPKTDFKENGFFTPYRYNQIFGREFVNNLSILDLLFCEGRNTLEVLRKSTTDGLLKA